MEKELAELFQRAKKAADVAAADDGAGSSPEEERCLDALERLKKFPVTRDVLISTEIGKNLRKLTKHPRKKIQALASDVMEKWKVIFVQGNDDDPTVSKGKKEEESKPDSKKVGKQGIIKLKQKAPVPVNSPGMSSLETNDKNRDKIRELLAEALCKVASEAADEKLRQEVSQFDPYHVAAMVETALYKDWGLFNGDKKAKYRSLMFNMKDANNPDFRRKVLLGELPPASIIQLSTEDMASNARKLQNEKIRKRALFDCERVQSVQASGMEIKCEKCKKFKTTYNQMQTRRADEPMTTFATCLNCGHRWKFS